MNNDDYRFENSDVFALGIPGNLSCKGVHWVYSPLAGAFALVDDMQFNALKRAFCNPSDIPPEIRDEYRQLTDYDCSASDLRKAIECESFSRLVIIPNTKCNFNCSYCFSAAGRMGLEVDLQTCYSAVDDYLERNKEPSFKLGFVGGGEPMLSFDIIEKTLEYASRKAHALGMECDFHIVTNGSIIDEDVIRVLKKHNVTLGISFDVLKDVQEMQRSQYDLVSRNIRRFIDAGIVPGIKTTITPSCVSRMDEMLAEVSNRFPEIRYLLFQVVNAPDLFEDEESFHAYLSEYIRNFFSAKHKGKLFGISVQDTLQGHCRQASCRYCPGEYCLTPSGTLSACECVSSPKEKMYGTFVYGTVEAGRVQVDWEKLLQLKKCNIFSEEKCSGCFAKYHCGSDCLYRKHLLPPRFYDAICNYNREFIRRELFDVYSEEFESVTGKTLSSFLSEQPEKQ